MQNRSDRIHFPQVSSHELWECVDVGYGTQTPERVRLHGFGMKSSREGINEVHESVDFMSQSKYFEWRERAGIMTPAKTPSDILRRGPVFVDESDSEELSQIFTFPVACTEYLEEQVRFHRARQSAIESKMHAFVAKMQAMLDWHREQELINQTLLLQE